MTRATLLQSVLQKAKEVREDHPEQVIETEGTDPAGSRSVVRGSRIVMAAEKYDKVINPIESNLVELGHCFFQIITNVDGQKLLGTW